VSTRRCGLLLNPLRPRSAAYRKRSVTGSSAMRSTAASAKGLAAANASSSRHCSAKSRSCVGPITSSRRPARFSILPDRPPTQELKAYIDQHRDIYRVEPICKVLQIALPCYRRHAALLRDPALRCDRTKQDVELIPQVQWVWHANMQVYGAD